MILGHEGAGIVREIGGGVTSVKPGDHVIPLYTPGMPAVQIVPARGKINLCHRHPRHPGQGPDAGRHPRAFPTRAQLIHHYMGCSTFSNFTVLPEIAVAKIRQDAPFPSACYCGCGVTTGRRRGDQHGQGDAGLERHRLRAGRHRAQRDPGGAHGGRRQDYRRRHQ